MHAPLLSPLQKRLLDDWQRGLPLVPRPFAVIAGEIGVDEEAVVEATAEMMARGVVSRVGLVVRPNTAGASTLAAVACPATRVDEIAAIVSAEPGVNHNYEREHPDLPIWFVATGANRGAVDAALDRLREATGCAVLDLPLEREYRIDLGFALDGPHRPHDHSPAKRPATEAERHLLAALADGLPVVARPFAEVAARLDLTEAAVTAILADLLAAGIVKRIGYVVRHRPLGFSANAMVVFDIDETRVDDVAAAFLASAAVTLLYRRRPAGERWPYRLYAMIHGRDRATVEGEAAALLARWPEPIAHRILFSTRCFKQTGARMVL
ncbi:MAG: Lrp/AsnC family transcriptional regulator [Siculibacillus sp.]|nr:Lrp/AsnC family transcriptional regulator [Siculibacillus sp.]